MGLSFSFSKSNRIKSTKEFVKIRVKGRNYRGGCFYLNHLDYSCDLSPKLAVVINESNNIPRLGITIAKRVVRKAHDRNRIKRIIREYFRHNKHTLSGDIAIVLFKRVNEIVLTSELKKTFAKITPTVLK